MAQDPSEVIGWEKPTFVDATGKEVTDPKLATAMHLTISLAGGEVRTYTYSPAGPSVWPEIGKPYLVAERPDSAFMDNTQQDNYRQEQAAGGRVYPNNGHPYTIGPDGKPQLLFPDAPVKPTPVPNGSYVPDPAHPGQYIPVNPQAQVNDNIMAGAAAQNANTGAANANTNAVQAYTQWALGNGRLSLDEAKHLEDLGYNLGIKLPLDVAADQRQAQVAQANVGNNIATQMQTGAQNNVANNLAYMPYRASPGFAQGLAAITQDIARQGGGPSGGFTPAFKGFAPSDFMLPPVDLAAQQAQGAQNGLAAYQQGMSAAPQFATADPAQLSQAAAILLGGPQYKPMAGFAQ